MKAILIHVPQRDTLTVHRCAPGTDADLVARRFYWSLTRRQRLMTDVIVADVYDEPAPPPAPGEIF